MRTHAGRRRRRRRLAVAAAFAALLVVLAVVGDFWRRSVLETRRAEATHLLTLAREHFLDGPTEALAYATASLELMDSRQARSSAVRALWAGPPARVLDHQPDWSTGFVTHAFSPDGQWLAIGGIGNEYVLVYGAEGGRPLMLGGHTVGTAGGIDCAWTAEGLLVTGHWTEGRVRVWSMPKGSLVNTIDLGGPAWWQVGEKHLLAEVDFSPLEDSSHVKLRRWALPYGEAEDLGSIDWTALGAASSCFNPNGREWIYAKGDGVYSRPLPMTDSSSDRLIARHPSGGVEVGAWRRPKGFWSGDSAGGVTLWALRQGETFTSRTLPVPETASGWLLPDLSGRWTVRNSSSPNVGQRLLVWDRDALSVAQPWPLTTPNFASTFTDLIDFHPAGNWIVAATSMVGRSTMWPLSTPRALEVHVGFGYVRFSPDGQYLMVYSGANVLRLCSVPKNDVSQVVDVPIPHPTTATSAAVAAFDANGEHVLLTGWGPDLSVVSLTGGEPIALAGFPPTDRITRAAGFSPSGRLVAAASRESATQPTLRVWDLETGKTWAFDQSSDPDGFPGVWANSLGFASETVLYTSGGNGLYKWDVMTGAHEQILEPPPGGIVIMRLTADGQHMLTFKIGPDYNRLSEPVELHDLTTGDVSSLEIQGTGSVALSPDGSTWASGEEDGVVRVGRVDGGEPHLLLGHTGRVSQCEISPDSRWVATFGRQDKILRLWPMPDLSKPPLHTLPREELIAKLKSLTNLRAVRDEDSPTGWSLEIGPFPGWETVPTW
jgi:WD40 repeat protein